MVSFINHVGTSLSSEDSRLVGLESSSDLGLQPTRSAASKPRTTKTIEERYQKKTPLEHILHRPESYIGSVQSDTQTTWIWDEATGRMVFKPVTYVPGLYKIFDEILVNAADVKAREKHERRGHSQPMTFIKIEFDQENSTIMIHNDGEGIPIEMHREHGVYVPELIFGHLLTSDNYDDSEERVTGGRNGYGAKLTNIFSKKFTVECADTTRQRKFRKTWKNNMTKSDPCKITEYKDGKKDYVKITFEPDLQRFQVDRFDDDFIALLTKRVYDVAGCCSVKVWLNGRKLPVDNFKSYVDLYLPNPIRQEGRDGASLLEGAARPPIKIHEKSDRWEVIISMSEGQFQQVSFVNAIATSKGGSHVNYVTDPLVQAILKKVNTKNKGGMELKAHHVKAHLWIFVNALVVNPTFDSQSKETLTLRASQFGSKFTLSERTITAVVKSEIIESILLWAKTKQQVELQKKLKGTSGRGGRDRVSGVPKLEDANEAGTKHAEQCTLILTEGESAKTSCVAGLSVVGRDRYGVFPLRGKLLNVREASFKQQVENQEIQSILKIMGLQVGKKIDTPKGLRYGSLMIMTDQDLDGSHIKGLLINMIAHYWPQLLQYQGFLKEFVTPIVKVSRKNQHLAFFTLTEYDNWRQRNDGGKGWKIRYYKGLGTSTDREFKEYFSQLERHSLEFVYRGEQDLNAIDMAFNAKRAEDRKQWIQNYQEGVFVDHSQPTVSYSDFIHKELVQFSKYDVFRSIPNCIDGLKPVQRKVLFAAFKRNLKSEIKVAQFTGYISECTSYHHGEQSLGTTIIGMAQTFVGSNNINILQPCGQFGSRKEGGKDASAVRYIFTRLAHVTRALFPEADDALLEYQNDDGTMIEPKYYIPIIPLVLVNGVEGIGTGWSSSVPNYNPRELIDNVRKFMRGEPMEPMTPWYKGFKGRIEQKPGGFESVGIIQKLDHETLEITELPVKVWTQNYKQFLEELMNDSTPAAPSDTEGAAGPRSRGSRSGAGTQPFSILDYRDNSSHESIHFTVKLSPSNMAKVEAEGLEKAFKLRKSIGTMNMTLFDTELKVQRYATELDIVREFGQLRLQYYELRRTYLIEKLERECRILRNKVRFIGCVVDGTFVISNRKKDDIVKELTDKQFDTYNAIQRASALIWRLEQQRAKMENEQSQNPEAEDESLVVGTATFRDYEYLLGMSLWTLSLEKIEELKKHHADRLSELEQLKYTTPENLWEADLLTLERALDEQDAMDASTREEDQQFKAIRRKSLDARGSFAKRGARARGTRDAKTAGLRTARKARKRQESDDSSSEGEAFTSNNGYASDDEGDSSDDEPINGRAQGRKQFSEARGVEGQPKTATLGRPDKRVPNGIGATTQPKTKPDARVSSTQSSVSTAWNALEATAGLRRKADMAPNVASDERGTHSGLAQTRGANPTSSTSLADRVKQRMAAKNTTVSDHTEETAGSITRGKTLEEFLGITTTLSSGSSVNDFPQPNLKRGSEDKSTLRTAKASASQRRPPSKKMRNDSDNTTSDSDVSFGSLSSSSTSEMESLSRRSCVARRGRGGVRGNARNGRGGSQTKPGSSKSDQSTIMVNDTSAAVTSDKDATEGPVKKGRATTRSTRATTPASKVKPPKRRLRLAVTSSDSDSVIQSDEDGDEMNVEIRSPDNDDST